MTNRIKKGFDSGFASGADYEEGFQESDKTRWEKQHKGGLFDFSKTMETHPLRESIQESLEESSPEKQGMQVSIEERLSELGISQSDIYEEEDDGSFALSDFALSEYDTGHHDDKMPKFSGEVAKHMALEDMTETELAEIGLEPGTFSPLEPDDGSFSL